MRVQCEKCDHRYVALMGERARCPQCGHEQVARSDARFLEEPAATPGPSRLQQPTPPPNPAGGNLRGRGVTGLVLNVLIPGLGTYVLRRPGEAGLQLLFLLAGILTIPWLVGLAVIAGVWAWAVLGAVVFLTTTGSGKAARR